LTEFFFNENGAVQFSQLPVSMETIFDLEDNLLLFFTGISRSASSILKDQDSRSRANGKDMLENLHFTKNLGIKSRDALLAGELNRFGELMHEHWDHKKSRSLGMTNQFIDDAYGKAMQSGGIGGKIVGAGGGGFLLIYASDREKLRNEMSKLGLEEVRFSFDFEGTKVMLS